MLHLTVLRSPSAVIGPTPQNRAMFRPSSGKRLPVRLSAQEQIVVLKVRLLFPSWNTHAHVETVWLVSSRRGWRLAMCMGVGRACAQAM